MKPRNREINIFNLSMMDVISGAMGAFLILVVILSRHYNNEVINTERILELQKMLVEATGNLSEVSQLIRGNTTDTDLIERSLEQARGNVERSKAYVRQVRDQLDAANAKISQLEERILSLEEEISYLEGRLAALKPFFVMTRWSCNRVSNVDIYLWNDAETRVEKGEKSRRMEPFDPRRVQRSLFYNEVEEGTANARIGLEVWSYSLSHIDKAIKLYYRLDDDRRPLPVCRVVSWIRSKELTLTVDAQTLNPRQPWLFVGMLRIDKQRRVSFQLASDRQRRAEHLLIQRRISGRTTGGEKTE